MLIQIPNVLNPDQLAACRRMLEVSEWVDGKVTAGHQSRIAKDNMQLAESDPAAIDEDSNSAMSVPAT